MPRNEGEVVQAISMRQVPRTPVVKARAMRPVSAVPMMDLGYRVTSGEIVNSNHTDVKVEAAPVKSPTFGPY
ncbi:MAG: hypothetical protein LBQ59_03965 [Candidatus Peribacteria bacterium]|jgi:hypothetical protein|nr:hypothetical protein [Candidatus Peribacteria bacterium]